MGLAESWPVTVCSGRRTKGSGRSGADYTVVGVRGEQDMGTVAVLSAAMADAIARDADVVVDLSGVAFIDASTLGVILGHAASSELRPASTAWVAGGRAADPRAVWPWRTG